MKKIIITTCAILMMSVTANACGGITIKGNSGADYCLSKQAMNWYSAYAWCKDQGMELIDLDSVCKSSTSCSELKLSDDEQSNITDKGGAVDAVWMDTSANPYAAFRIFLSSGDIQYGHFRTNSGYALCF